MRERERETANLHDNVSSGRRDIYNWIFFLFLAATAAAVRCPMSAITMITFIIQQNWYSYFHLAFFRSKLHSFCSENYFFSQNNLSIFRFGMSLSFFFVISLKIKITYYRFKNTKFRLSKLYFCYKNEIRKKKEKENLCLMSRSRLKKKKKRRRRC